MSVRQVDPEFNPDLVMGPNDEVPRQATSDERETLGLQEPDESVRFAVRVHGRGVITQFNGAPITERETAEAIVRSIDLMYGEKCSIETLVLDLPVPPRAENGHPGASA